MADREIKDRLAQDFAQPIILERQVVYVLVEPGKLLNLTRRPTCPKCSTASPITPSIASKACCPAHT